MIILQPSAQLLDQAILPEIDELFFMKSILDIELVAVYCLHHNQHKKNSLKRFAPCGIYQSELEAKMAAVELRTRGRSFAIACVPGIRINFGFHSLLSSVGCRSDYEAYLPCTYTREENVYRVGKITHPEPFLAGLAYRDFYTTLCKLLDPEMTLVSRVALASLESNWRAWDKDLAFYKCSYIGSGRSLEWLPIKLAFYTSGLGEALFDLVTQQFQRFFDVA